MALTPQNIQKGRQMGDVYFQSHDRYLPDHHIQFDGDHNSFYYTESQDMVDTILIDKGFNLPFKTIRTRNFDIAVFNPVGRKRELSAGDKGVLVASTPTGYTYHMEVICNFVGTQDWMSGGSWQDAYILNYKFDVLKIQIGNTEYYVVRIDMGDGTFTQLLMTEAEKEMYGTQGFTERYLNSLAVNRWK